MIFYDEPDEKTPLVDLVMRLNNAAHGTSQPMKITVGG